MDGPLPKLGPKLQQETNREGEETICCLLDYNTRKANFQLKEIDGMFISFSKCYN